MKNVSRFLIVLMAFLMVGCSSRPVITSPTTTAAKQEPKVVFTTSYKEDIYDDDLMEIWKKTIGDKENFRFLDFSSWDHYPETEKVNGYSADLYTINSKYIYNDKVYGNRMLIRFIGPGRYEILRYQNYLAGN